RRSPGVASLDEPRRIFVRVDRAATLLTMETDSGVPAEMAFELPGEHRLSAVHDGLLPRLQHFRSLTGPGRLDYAAARLALNLLRDLGTDLPVDYLGGPDQLEAAQWFFRTAVPDWRDHDGADVHVVFEAPPAALFPIGVLPLFDYTDPWEVRDSVSLLAAA